jgi:uncharacterized SAM-dependent methyltransferase
VITGLSQAQKTVPARFLYDERGSQLFEAITGLPEYYPARAEIEILRRHSGDIAQLASRGRVVVELGSGSSAKTPLLLDEVDAAAYVPIDISDRFFTNPRSRSGRNIRASTCSRWAATSRRISPCPRRCEVNPRSASSPARRSAI